MPKYSEQLRCRKCSKTFDTPQGRSAHERFGHKAKAAREVATKVYGALSETTFLGIGRIAQAAGLDYRTHARLIKAILRDKLLPAGMVKRMGHGWLKVAKPQESQQPKKVCYSLRDAITKLEARRSNLDSQIEVLRNVESDIYQS